ncbi:EAL domain-containing protein [Bacterioplanoides sp.]|uniref:bifunctional diguanylate cyclase/phosphodiesterase n=1 Tax=Bacterioplanoides sp. TaxID=2066072 RepID=UPI003AFFFF68
MHSFLSRSKSTKPLINRYLTIWLLSCAVLIFHLMGLWSDTKALINDEFERQQRSYFQTLEQQLVLSHTPLSSLSTQEYPGLIRTRLYQNLSLTLYSTDGYLMDLDHPEKAADLSHLLGEEVPLRVLSSLQQHANTPLHYSDKNDNLNNQAVYRRIMSVSAANDQVAGSQELLIEVALPITDVYQRFARSSIAGVVLWLLTSLAIYFSFYRERSNHLKLLTKEKVFIKSLKKSESTTSLFLNNISGCAYQADYPSYKLKFVTQGSEHIFSLPADDFALHHYSLLDFLHEDDKDNVIRQIEKHVKEQSSFEFVCRLTQGNKSRWAMNKGQITTSKNGNLIIEGLLVDITDQKLSQQQVEYLATRDPLTELANRYCFNDEMISHINRDTQHQQPFALLLIDLDRFKTINESLGHQVGDRLIRLVSERLKKAVNEKHLLARLGGDEFIIMMNNPGESQDIIVLAHHIRDILAQTFQLDYYKLSTTCSIGISLYPDNATESNELMQHADTAMYKAKEKGGNCYQFFSNDMNHQAKERLILENELRKAIKLGQFELHYQPQVTTESNVLLGAEALIRWNHPERGMISPVDFIPIAEETGMIKEIGDWALDQACSVFSRWNKQFGLNLIISVNVSARQLSEQFVTRVKNTLDKYQFPAEQLELEITESLLMDNLNENIRLMQKINELGVDFAMDDFGTGYSSLSYLKQFPLGKLKIDRSFINDITSDADDEAIVRAIIAMVNTLKLKLVAEGVENDQQLSMLSEMNCYSYQGYYFSRPLPEKEFQQRYVMGDNIQSIF